MDTVVVTGADQPLGRAVATGFAGTDAVVVVGVRDPAAGAELESTHDRIVRSVRADPRDEFDTERLMEQASRAGGSSGIAVVAPCACVYHGTVGETPLDRTPYSALDDTFRTNTRGVFAAVVEALPHLDPDGRVLVPTGRVADGATPGFGAFGVSAAATAALVRGFSSDRDELVIAALEVGDAGVHDAFTPEDAAGLFTWAAELPDSELDGDRVTVADWRAATT